MSAKIYLLAIAFFFAFHPVIYDLRNAVLTNELAHHTPLVILLVGYLLYVKRKELAKVASSPLTRGNATWMVAGLTLNLLGQWAGIYYLAQLSIPITLYGSLSYLSGKELARFLLPTLFFLVLAFPLPGKVYISLVFPLKLLVTKISGLLLSFFGLPVQVEGNVIELPPLIVGVDDACSGVSSLMAMMTLAFFCGFLVLRTWKSRLIILISVIPVVIFANVLRVTLSTVVAWRWGAWVLEGGAHVLWGMAVFLLAFFLLLVMVIYLAKGEKGRG